MTISYSHSEQIFGWGFGGIKKKKRLKIYRVFLKSETVREDGVDFKVYAMLFIY